MSSTAGEASSPTTLPGATSSARSAVTDAGPQPTSSRSMPRRGQDRRTVAVGVSMSGPWGLLGGHGASIGPAGFALQPCPG